MALVGAWGLIGLEVRTDITDFVPESDDAALEDVAREITDSELSRTTMLTVGPFSDPHHAAQFAGALGDALEHTLVAPAHDDAHDDAPALAWVRSGPPAGLESTFYELYFPRRFAFSAPDAEAARALTTDAALTARARALRDELAGPMSMLVRRVAPEDPLLFFPAALRAFQGTSAPNDNADAASEDRSANQVATLEVVDGRFVAHEPAGSPAAGAWAVVLLASRGSTFRADVQEPVLLAIERLYEATRRQLAPEDAGVHLEQAGVARFAVRTERALRADTTRISVVSTALMVLLFVVLFRGPRFLVLGSVPLVLGTAVSIAACRLVFGSVHAITLAFGSSLLGVGIDFISHYANHHVLEPEATPEATMARIRPGLVLGALTTVAGLAGLGFTSFPGMRELALFAASGVFASLAFTVVLVPPFMPDVPRPTRVHLALAASQRWLFERVRRNALAFSLVPIAALVVVALGLPRLQFVDDLRRLNEVDPALASEDRAVRARIGQGDAGRFVIALGDDDDDALLAAEAASAALEDARAAGELSQFRSITPFLRSAATQGHVDAVWRTPGLAERTLQTLEREGFVAAPFAAFQSALGAPPPVPLSFAMLQASPLAPLVEPFRVEVTDRHGARRVGYLAFVQGVSNPDALEARLAPLRTAGRDVHYFDQARFLASAYRTFRERSLLLVALGVALVFAMCVARYRSVVLGIASIAPALLASLTALALVALGSSEANLMHLVACLLVLSMGEDYAVFLLEERDAPEGPATTMSGIVLACSTTVLSFGLLAASSHPALRALGFVTAVGVGLSFVFAPLALVIARAAGPSPRPPAPAAPPNTSELP